MTGFIFIIALLIAPLSQATAAGQADQKKVSEWAKQVCRDLGIMSLGTMQMGVNISALGMVTENGTPELKNHGFKFGEGPYRIHATRIDTGRYLVSIQAMSRPNDNDRKLIRLNTKADTLYPVSIPAAPAGKYMWNAAIQYDMEDQLGIRPDSEMEQEPVSFVNFRIVDPAKFQASGLSGNKNKAPTQMVFKEIIPGILITVMAKRSIKTGNGLPMVPQLCPQARQALPRP